MNIWKHGRPKVTLAGWGEKSPRLRAVTNQIITWNEYMKAVKKENLLDTKTNKRVILTNYKKNPSGGQAGDSGGPLWWQNMKNHKIYQVGVFVANGSNLPWKNQYSAINENYQWIKDTLKANRVKI